MPAMVMSTQRGIEFHAGAAGGGENAAPVGIAAGESGLDQRRSGDGFRDSARGGFGFRAAHFDFDHALRAFAVGDDLQRERAADFFECGGERAMRRVAGLDRCGAPAAPLARTSSVSLVEVSPSTLMELKVREVTSRSVFCNSDGAMAASVTTKASVVAMLG